MIVNDTKNDYTLKIKRLINNKNEVKKMYISYNDSTEISENKYSYDDIKNIAGDFKMNWMYLTNKERKQFLERFVDVILVDKIDGKVKIQNVKFSKFIYNSI